VNQYQGLFEAIGAVARRSSDRDVACNQIASLIRESRAYRWVGIYEVGGNEISVLGWSGPRPPEHPTFSPDAGLCGRAAAERAIVSVDDVTRDPDYLTTLASTRSEIIVPVLNNSMQPIGLIDVESERVAAFSQDDRDLLSRCATAIAPLWMS
jgi:L-methionine (R)-S-oxide reductase